MRRQLLTKLANAEAGLTASRLPKPAPGQWPYAAGAEQHSQHASRCLAILQELLGDCQVLPPSPPHVATPAFACLACHHFRACMPKSPLPCAVVACSVGLLPHLKRAGRPAPCMLDSCVAGWRSPQGRVMPVRPAHAASFLGHPLRLEVQSQLKVTIRTRVNTWTNAYVGQLRRQVAQMVAVPAWNLRLLHGGALSTATAGARAVPSSSVCEHSALVPPPSACQATRAEQAPIASCALQQASKVLPAHASAGSWALVFAGRELNSDAKLVKEARLQESHCMIAMFTPVQLEYAQPQAEDQVSLAEMLASQVCRRLLLHCPAWNFLILHADLSGASFQLAMELSDCCALHM